MTNDDDDDDDDDCPHFLGAMHTAPLVQPEEDPVDGGQVGVHKLGPWRMSGGDCRPASSDDEGILEAASCQRVRGVGVGIDPFKPRPQLEMRHSQVGA